ncbi:ulp1 protease family, C-terminal catalytic domain-containing protein [Tanacetum coccineum]
MDGVSQCMNVDRFDKNWNDVSDNFHVDGLDHHSVEGVSHCTSVDHISQRLNEVDESVAIDGLIRLRSQDVDHTSKESIGVDDNDFKVKDNEEANFLSTQQVRELMKEVFDTPSGPDSIQVNNVKDVDESDIKTVVVPFQLHKFPDKIPLYLDNAEVFDKKNIDKASYSISFRYADGVPLQGGLYGDCGLWVCIFLYRLSHKIPLEIDDPINFALAYHERMIEVYWKNKMLL